MKHFVFVFVALLVSTTALPSPVATPSEQDVERSGAPTRLISDTIASVIEDISQQIKDAGLDPLYIEEFSAAYQLPVPILFSVSGYIENLLAVGVSDIEIRSLSYAVLTSRLTLDIALPHISISIAAAGIDATILGSEFGAQIDGRLVIDDISVNGELRFNVGVITGISLRSSDLSFNLRGLNYVGRINALGLDLTSFVSDQINRQIPTRIRELNSEINQLINIIVADVITSVLN